METSRRWKLTVETERVVVLSRHGGRAVGWCPHCGELVELLSDAEMPARARAEIERATSEGGLPQRRLHAAETSDGTLLICSKSLAEERRSGTGNEESGKAEV